MKWYRKLLNLARPEKVTAEIERELSFHIAERVAEYVGAGMTHSDARRRALMEFGNYAAHKERTRDTDVCVSIEASFRDVRFGARMLLKNSGFAAAVVVTLALGIAPSIAIFGVVNFLVLRPLPVQNPVAADVRYRGMTGPVAPYFYVPFAQRPGTDSWATVQIRTARPPDSMTREVERALASFAPDQPVWDVKTMHQALYTIWGLLVFRLAAGFDAFLGTIALTLTLAGFYGVVSYDMVWFLTTHAAGHMKSVFESPLVRRQSELFA